MTASGRSKNPSPEVLTWPTIGPRYRYRNLIRGVLPKPPARAVRAQLEYSLRPSPSLRLSRVSRMSQHDEPSLRYGEGTEKLSQLSDIVSLSQENEPHSLQLRTRSLNTAQQSLFDLVEDLPSQAILPTPELPFASQRNDDSGACVPQQTKTDINSDTSAILNMPSGVDEQAYAPESTRNSRRATRRG